MSTLYVTRGLPASGKTAWAKAWVGDNPKRARINRDDLRAMIHGEHTTYQWDQEKVITEASRAAVLALLKAGVDVVADDMNLRPKYVREWLRFCQANGFDCEVVEFPIDPADAIDRDAERDKPVGPGVIAGMVKRYTNHGELLPVPDEDFDQPSTEVYIPDPSKPKAIIVDIDGTLALRNGRSPYDLTRVSEDLPNWPVIEAVTAAAERGVWIIYCSGREESARADTETWLSCWVGRHPAEPLLMRPEGDKRKDSIVKRELFDLHIRNNYNVLYVLDDRQQVVDMWRSLGLTCFQVAKGDF